MFILRADFSSQRDFVKATSSCQGKLGALVLGLLQGSLFYLGGVMALIECAPKFCAVVGDGLLILHFSFEGFPPSPREISL